MFGPDQTSPCAPVRVLVVDDTEVSRQVLAEVVAATPGFEVVGDAASGREAIELIGPLGVQLLLLDVEMPDLDGIETATRIRGRYPGVVILLLTAAEGASLRVSSLTVEDKRILSPGWLADFWGRHSHSRWDSRA